jgi:Protein O-mannosyl-transferase TMEM260-like
MKTKTLRIIIGIIVFLSSLIIFLLTVQPSVSFWDPGEISAASYSLMVPHPPGGPFWLLLGRIFSMIPFGSDIGYRINLVSVFSSALSILLLYSIAIKLIENYRGKVYTKVSDALFTDISAAIGALAFAFSETFWFNAVESNYFALGTLLYSLVVWLMMVWNEKRNDYGNEKYIILVAYIIGIATGVHLMSVLAILTFVSLVVMRKYVTDEKHYLDTAKLFLIHISILGVVSILLWASQTGNKPPSVDEYKAFDSKFIWIMIAISVIYMGIFFKKIFNRNSFYVPLLIGGVVLGITYPGIVKIFPSTLLKIGGPDPLPNLIIFVVLLAVLVYLTFWTSKNKKSFANIAIMSFLFVLLGNTTYTMIIIRANENTPMNENNPSNFTKLIYYLDREQYGDFPIFKRRFSEEPNQAGIYTNYSSDLDYLWRYQINHMFNRYFLWNFAGRSSTVQDAPADWTKLWGIPFLMGLLGLYFHFRKDWKMASIFLILFVFMGYLIAFYQNQQQPQPRERHYFYAGAFFVFSIWISLGTRELAELIREKLSKFSFNNTVGFSLLAVVFILVPLKMLTQNYYTHDRSKNWLPWDFSYNLLQGCKPNAILFTGGDNDTFPVWYLQYVEGVRRDVRIVNLSLANTDWYLLQLKNTEPYGAEKVPFSLSDQDLASLHPIRWTPTNVSLRVPTDIMKEFGVSDTTELRTNKITFRMPNTIQFGDIKAIRMQDIAVKDIITANNWKRPIYFATTCSPDSWIGLDNFLRFDGLVQRLTPIKNTSGMGNINDTLIHHEVFNPNPSFSKSYDPHYKFRGVADKDVFFDEVQSRLLMNYRNIFFRLADYYLESKEDSSMCTATLDQMEKIIPRSHIPMDYRFLYEVGNLYYSAGAFNKFKEVSKDVISIAKSDLDESVHNLNSPYNAFNILENVYVKLKEYDNAIDVLNQLESYFPGNQQIKQEINRLERMKRLK